MSSRFVANSWPVRTSPSCAPPAPHKKLWLHTQVELQTDAATVYWLKLEDFNHSYWKQLLALWVKWGADHVHDNEWTDLLALATTHLNISSRFVGTGGAAANHTKQSLAHMLGGANKANETTGQIWTPQAFLMNHWKSIWPAWHYLRMPWSYTMLMTSWSLQLQKKSVPWPPERSCTD